MNDGKIVVKTPKGIDEIEKRTAGLPARARQLLIMADGKRDIATLSQLVNTPDVDDVLIQLMKGGFLTFVTHQSTVPQATTRDGIDIPVDPQERLKLARNFIINTTETFVGVFGTGLIEKANKAQHSQDLQKLIPDWEGAMISGAGKKRAADLKTKLTELL